MDAKAADNSSTGRQRYYRQLIEMRLLPETAAEIREELDASEEAASKQNIEETKSLLALLQDHLVRPYTYDNAPAPEAPKSRVYSDAVAEIFRTETDLREKIREKSLTFPRAERGDFYISVSDKYFSLGNVQSGFDSLAEAEAQLKCDDVEPRIRISRRYLLRNEAWRAASCLANSFLTDTALFTPLQRRAMQHALEKGEGGRGEHGHALLLKALESTPPATLRHRILLEVGTTRERTPGQGSTMKLAKFCQAHNMHFVTVDMDPDNSLEARKSFDAEAMSFEAVTDRGESYLSNWNGRLDYVFLDAYDFDHGKHSELRQGRYEKFLGSRIDESECHEMHLKCAIALVDCLSPDGLICIDDTWRDAAGNWTAKGTLAVPYLLDNGFQIIREAQNAILLSRHKAGATFVKDNSQITLRRLILDVDHQYKLENSDHTEGWRHEEASLFYEHLKSDLDPQFCFDLASGQSALPLILASRFSDVPVMSIEFDQRVNSFLRHNAKSNGLESISVLPSEEYLEKNSEDLENAAVFKLIESINGCDRFYGRIGSRAPIEIFLEKLRDKFLQSQDWLLRFEFSPMRLVSQGIDPTEVISSLIRDYAVSEFPDRYGYRDRLRSFHIKGLVSNESSTEFVEYCRAKERNDLGTVDLLLSHPCGLLGTAGKK
ncbi:hypothetical protein LOS8367_03683 [Limimaricola soesokkakensis]|uniref:Methyltransferase family protein n=1 Tax=Limimaricola soesokkakensis TaxID=1343159 RepID=A0A1X7A7H2_9RHOB|nr:hypothetical protein LOS8367_03683 [Limimaricola soesokkakensis]